MEQNTQSVYAKMLELQQRTKQRTIGSLAHIQEIENERRQLMKLKTLEERIKECSGYSSVSISQQVQMMYPEYYELKKKLQSTINQYSSMELPKSSYSAVFPVTEKFINSYNSVVPIINEFTAKNEKASSEAGKDDSDINVKLLPHKLTLEGFCAIIGTCITIAMFIIDLIPNSQNEANFKQNEVIIENQIKALDESKHQTELYKKLLDAIEVLTSEFESYCDSLVNDSENLINSDGVLADNSGDIGEHGGELRDK